MIKKTTLIILLMLFYTAMNYAQCINTNPYPSESIASDNSGDEQQINSCVYTGDYSTVANLLIGSDYVFSLNSNNLPADKYITVTDINNNPIANGPSPLTVSAINVGAVRIHYTENDVCDTMQWCLESYVKVILSCPFPTEIQVNNVTTTAASFQWNAASETSWEVLLLLNGAPAPTASTEGISVTGTPAYSVSNLEAAQQYQFYIRSDCGSEFSPWRGPLNFNSGCDPIATFTENFDASPDLPSCWTALKVNASPFAFIGINSLSNSSPNAVQIANDNSGSGAQLLLISPNLSTVGTGSHRLKFYTRGYGNVTLQVGTIDTTTSDGTFNLIETINATANYTEHVVSFTSYTGSDTFVAFRHANTNTYNPVFIDDIRWEQSPLCADVQDIIATELTQNTATIGWTPGGLEEQWDVVYSETATDPSTLTPISPAPDSPEATISGLQPNTTYKAWVRSSCGETLGLGTWMNPITFTTACNSTNILDETFESVETGALPSCWAAILGDDSVLNSTIKVVSNNASTGSKAIQLFNGDEGSNSKIILVAPSLNTVSTGTHRVKFYAKSNSPATLEVGTLGSAANGSTFTLFQSISVTPVYQEYVVDFTTYAGTNNYIGFRHASGQYINIYLDDVRWELTPQCADVTQITANNTNAVSTSLQWTANAQETNWDVVYGAENVTDPNTLTPITPAPTVNPAAMISGLTPNTNYKAWVRSVCGGTLGNGAWIGPIAFKTACLPIGEFTEGFETTSYGELPDCWSRVLAGPTLGQYAAVRTVNNDAAFGNNAVEIHANSSAPTDSVILVSPYLNTLGTGTHRLKFYVLSYNAATPFEIGTMNGNTSQATYTTFQSFTLGTGYNELLVDFTTYSGSDTYIAFRNVAGNYNSTFIDNVRWEIAPLCEDVTSIQYEDVETGTATITWDAGNSEPNWQVAYAPINVTDPSTVTASELLNDTTYDITGLEDNAFYNVWVRSVCGGTQGNGAWIGPIVFRTKCLPTEAPYSQDFESSLFPNLPDCTSSESFGFGNAWSTTYGDSGYGFDGKVIQYSGNSSAADAWYYTQGINLIGGTEYKISYKYGNNSDNNYAERMQVLYGTSPKVASMTNEIADHTEINTGMAMTNEVVFTPLATGDYYFGFHAYSLSNQGNLFLDNIVVEQTLSIGDEEKNTLISYPNPVQDILTISSQSQITNVMVVNLLGQKVLEKNYTETDVKLNMSGLPSGSYLVRITADNAIRTIKILKQ